MFGLLELKRNDEKKLKRRGGVGYLFPLGNDEKKLKPNGTNTNGTQYIVMTRRN